MNFPEFYGMTVESTDHQVFKLFKRRRLIAVVRRHENGACRKVWGQMNDLTLGLFQRYANRIGQ